MVGAVFFLFCVVVVEHFYDVAAAFPVRDEGGGHVDFIEHEAAEFEEDFVSFF